LNVAEASRAQTNEATEMEFKHYAHCQGIALAHFQFTPAYRRDIFKDEKVKSEIVACMRDDAQKMGVEIEALGFGPDHAHMYLSGWKNHAISRMAQQFKGHSSHVVREKHWDRVKTKLWGNKFWTSGYFFETVGRVAPDDIEWYVAKGQQKHWADPEDFKEVTLVKGQMALSDYN